MAFEYIDTSGKTRISTAANVAASPGIAENSGWRAIPDPASTQSAPVAAPVSKTSGIKLPDQPSLPNVKGKTQKTPEIPGITTSRPAINRDDIARQVKSEMGGARSALGNSYDTRIAEAKEDRVEENKAYEGQLGTRRRFSSSAEAFVKFIDEKNSKTIANLEVQKDDALANFDFKMAQLIETRIAAERQAQKDELDMAFKIFEFGEKQAEAEAKKNAPTIQASRENAIVGLFKQGIDDAGELSEMLNFDDEGNQIGDFSLDEINNVINAFQADKAKINDIVIDIGKNGASADLISRVSGAKNLAEAVSLAGDYLANPTGIVGEYMFYKRDAIANGQDPVDFNTYQTIDANRKISIARAAVAGTDLSPQQQAVFNKIVDKFNASEAIKAVDRASKLKDIVAEIKANPGSPSGQLNLIYAYIKGLDTDSAVREGEIDLVRGISSYLDKFSLSFERIANGKAIKEETALEIAEGAEKLIESIERTAMNKMAVFDAQAEQNGTAVYGAWKNFSESVQDSQFGGTGSDLIETEAAAHDKVTEIGTGNPTLQEQIIGLVTENDPDLGRPLSYQEVYSWLKANGYAQ